MEEQPKEPTEFRCLICGKLLIQLEEGGHHDKERWKGLFNNADTWEINCNYGSRHDTDKFIFGLCDDCIQIKIDAGLLIPHGNIRDEFVTDPLPPSFLESLRKHVESEIAREVHEIDDETA